MLEVRLYGYNNPTGRCQECGNMMGCCDRHNTTECGERFMCDTYFHYCLRPLGSDKEEGGGNCSDYGGITSNTNTNDRFVNFSQSMVLGLDNPLLLPGLTKESDWNVRLIKITVIQGYYTMSTMQGA